MLKNYELKGQDHQFFMECSAEEEVLLTILREYRGSTDNMNPSGFMQLLQSRGYQAVELTDPEGTETFVHFDGQLSVRDFMKRRIQQCITDQFFKVKGFEEIDFENTTVTMNGNTFRFYLFSHGSADGGTDDSITDDRLMLQNMIEHVKQMLVGHGAEKIIFDSIVEYQEQYAHGEVSHVDHMDSDEAVTFSDVLRLVVFTKDDSQYCPACFHDTPEDNFTIMNHVDKVLQSPLLNQRLHVSSHGHVVECPKCREWFELSEKSVLFRQERDEIQERWNALPQAEQY